MFDVGLLRHGSYAVQQTRQLVSTGNDLRLGLDDIGVVQVNEGDALAGVSFLCKQSEGKCIAVNGQS